MQRKKKIVYKESWLSSVHVKKSKTYMIDVTIKLLEPL